MFTIIFNEKNLVVSNLCNTFATVNKKQIKHFMIMRTMYLIEHYAINRKNGVWSLIGYSRVDYRVKNLVMKSVKKQGYQYNRSDKAITVKSYAI